MTDNEKFISGKFYEDSYTDRKGRYYECYVKEGIPRWARETNAHYVDYITMIHNLPPGAKVLDLGSGMGFFVGAWLRRGFDVRGVEIAERPILLSDYRHLITQTSVTDLSMFRDNEFDLVASVALLEHIDEGVLSQALAEIYRVGLRQSHLIGLTVGEDESHITIKTREEWREAFRRMNRVMKKYEVIWTLPDFVDNQDMCFVNTTYLDLMTYPMRKFVHDARARSEAEENPKPEKEEA